MKDISYEQFGINFVERAVTAERIADSISKVSGDSVEVGPMSAGPGGIATVNAVGKVGAVIVNPNHDKHFRFEATLPIDLELEVRLAGVPTRYRGMVEVLLRLSVHTVAPLTLRIDIAELTDDDISVELQAADAVGGVLQKVGNIDGEVRSQVKNVVNRRLSSDEAKATREIDVAEILGRSWD